MPSSSRLPRLPTTTSPVECWISVSRCWSKPLAATYEQSVDLVDRASRTGVPLMCGLLERYNPAVRTAREFAGDVWQVNGIRHSPFVSRIATGVATDLLIHDVDLAIGFVGAEPVRVRGEFGYFNSASRANEAEDCADAVLRFDSGAVATISASRVSQRKIRQLSLLEADRLIEIDLLRRDITIYRHIADDMPADRDGYQQQTVIEIPTIRYSEEPLGAAEPVPVSDSRHRRCRLRTPADTAVAPRGSRGNTVGSVLNYLRENFFRRRSTAVATPVKSATSAASPKAAMDNR